MFKSGIWEFDEGVLPSLQYQRERRIEAAVRTHRPSGNELDGVVFMIFTEDGQFIPYPSGVIFGVQPAGRIVGFDPAKIRAEYRRIVEREEGRA